jgi:hypothetical protein
MEPFHNVSVLNASFPSSVPQRSEIQTSSAYLLPSFKYVPFLPRVSFDSVEALVKGYLLPEKLHSMNDSLSPIHKDRLVRNPEHQSVLYGVSDVDDILVLICGHGGRDARCGILGPLLQDEFKEKLSAQGFQVPEGPVPVEESGKTLLGEEVAVRTYTARVSLISHIGGHKFAGNVIIYIPPRMKSASGEAHPLAGQGIWYGRVEPKHVEGIVRETVIDGKVITDMFRGGIKQGGEILRI